MLIYYDEVKYKRIKLTAIVTGCTASLYPVNPKGLLTTNSDIFQDQPEINAHALCQRVVQFKRKRNCFDIIIKKVRRVKIT